MSLNENRSKEQTKYNVLDLYAGAGGLSLGFVQQGHFRIVGVIEKNEDALKTYLHNHDSKNIHHESDMLSVNFKALQQRTGPIDIVIGGPPCQGFSNANRQKSKFISLNNLLVKKFVDAVCEIAPKAFVMENVAMLTSDVHKFFDSFLDHDTIGKKNIQTKNEKIVIMEQNPDGSQLMEMLHDKEEVNRYCLEDKVFNSIKLVKRYLEKPEKLDNYFKKYSSVLIRDLTVFRQKLGTTVTDTLLISDIDILLKSYEQRRMESGFKDALDEFMEFERGIGLMKELYDNQIRFELRDDGGKVFADVNSYTVFDYLHRCFHDAYDIDWTILNAAKFGVPQERRRFILMGIRKDLNKKVTMPDPGQGIRHTVRDAIFDLERYMPATDVRSDPIRRAGFSSNDFTRYLQKDSVLIYNHVNTDTREVAKKRFAQIAPGKNFHSLSQSMKENTYSDPKKTQNTIYQRLEYDKQCGTVVNVRKSMWIHPSLDRALSIREVARLQTFPDDYIFYGSKDSQYQQIGNAVPPLLAKAIANKLYNLLK